MYKGFQTNEIEDIGNDRQATTITFNVAHIVIYFIVLNLLIFVVLSITGTNLTNKLGVIFLASGYYLLSLASKKLPIRIEIRDADVKIKFIKFFKPQEEHYKINGIKCSFEKETRARGLKARVFRMESGVVTIMEAIPDQSGWSEQKLNMIFNSISKRKDLPTPK
jgi:hypothetical protein